ncbi:hypothetical protein HPP92_028835 [Vanilla planifolia]|uniref:Uncharacterized protein n=1 Tax=Vanilla planifolia TaxID=51239 RepID=A0A835P5V9_VANPL|nr:hypothetical protein HPP92_028835 [Vanilla planifolia]KAG0446457.1 hypothetical protein HPP92_028824 [Vanilla planifolia]
MAVKLTSKSTISNIIRTEQVHNQDKLPAAADSLSARETSVVRGSLLSGHAEKKSRPTHLMRNSRSSPVTEMDGSRLVRRSESGNHVVRQSRRQLQ